VSAADAILIFQLGPRLYATPAAAVVRIERADPGEAAQSPLGLPFAAARRLLFGDGQGGFHAFPVDAVLVVRQVPATDLRPLPPLAEGLVAPGVTGLLLWRGAPTPLVDLPTLVRRPAGAPPRAQRSRHG